MLTKVLLDLINAYNEKGVILCKCSHLQWFNGKRFEIWNVKRNYLKKLNCYFLQIKLNKILHTYIFSHKGDIDHYDGFKWETKQYYQLQAVNNENCGNYFYDIIYNGCCVSHLNQEIKSKFHGVVCYYATFFIIDLLGNIALLDHCNHSYVDIINNGKETIIDFISCSNFN